MIYYNSKLKAITENEEIDNAIEFMETHDIEISINSKQLLDEANARLLVGRTPILINAMSQDSNKRVGHGPRIKGISKKFDFPVNRQTGAITIKKSMAYDMDDSDFMNIANVVSGLALYALNAIVRNFENGSYASAKEFRDKVEEYNNLPKNIKKEYIQRGKSMMIIE